MNRLMVLLILGLFLNSGCSGESVNSSKKIKNSPKNQNLINRTFEDLTLGWA